MQLPMLPLADRKGAHRCKPAYRLPVGLSASLRCSAELASSPVTTPHTLRDMQGVCFETHLDARERPRKEERKNKTGERRRIETTAATEVANLIYE